MAEHLFHDEDDDEQLLAMSEGDDDDDDEGQGSCIDSQPHTDYSRRRSSGKARHYDTQIDTKGHRVSSSDSESDSESDSSASEAASLPSSSTSSSHDWEILSSVPPTASSETADADAGDVGEDGAHGLMNSVSREAKQMVTGLKVDMKEISDGYSKIASGVDRVTTGLADCFNRALSEGAKQAGNVVGNLKRDWLTPADSDGNVPSDSTVTEATSAQMISNNPQKENSTVKSASSSSLPPSKVPQNPQSRSSLDNRDKSTLRKITSVIHNSSTLLPINLKALHTQGVFSPTSEYSATHPVASEISYCGPGEQMIIETQQNDPFDPIAVLVVYEMVSTVSEESIGYLRLQAVWHCFEPVPHVGVSLGSEPTPSAESDSLTSLQHGNNMRMRCVTKQLDAADDDYYVQSITLVSEEAGTFVGRTFDKLVEKFKAF